MEIKFKRGDRVKALVDCSWDPDSYYKGATGTVRELDDTPTVDWDDTIRIQGRRSRGNWVNGRCIMQDKLTLLNTSTGINVWTRPKADNNIVNNAVRVLAKVYTHVSNVAVKVFKFLRGSK